MDDSRLITAYFDDTGKESDSVSVSLCGFVASVEQWLHFESNWKTILGMPQFGLAYFHTRELRQAKKPPFDKFLNNPVLREDLYDRLYRTILVRTAWSCAGTVVMADYNRVNSEYELRETLGPPHVIASAVAIQNTIRWCERHRSKAALKVVCDDGMDHFGMLSDQMYEVHGIRPEPGTVKETPGMQAADLVAWELQRAITDTLTKKIEFIHELRPMLKRILGIERGFHRGQIPSNSALRIGWFAADESQLRIVVEKANVPKRARST